MKSLKFIIIDEMSMIGARMLYMNERRLNEINPEKDEPFGGFVIYLLGDFRQLPLLKILLSTRVFFTIDELGQFQTAVELYPTNEQVKQSNENYLQSTGCPLAYIASENTPDIALPSSKDDSALGLSKYLNLSVNARIMPRVNLWVQGGLVNGSLGTISYIIHAPNARPPALPLFILVEFDSYQGPFIYGNLFPIIPITRSSNDGNILPSRRQFPLP
ncbi:uncharacterized protein [Centruroides vittatus]|uniref:uncharacterized protein n=1 Tax=Centruroides vittatus TaxID=120091 RepID=UPI00350F9C6A